MELAALHNFYPGKRDKAPWGDAMALLRTPSGDGYYINLHNTLADKDEFNEKNPASTCILGTNGSGKTMLMTFFEIMQQKYGREDSFSPDAKTKRLTTVYLDKDRGAEMNIRALGGRYYRVISGESTGWNPFSLPATKRNINFIKQLMKILCTRNGSTISPRDERRLSDAVNAVMNDEPQYRVYGITRMLENLPEPATKEARKTALAFGCHSGRRAVSSAGCLITSLTRSISATAITSASTERSSWTMQAYVRQSRFICCTALPACLTGDAGHFHG